jgi:uncharacterized protein
MTVAAPDAPFRQFIVKLHSRCNLSCDYCYVYHHVDQSWRDRPRVMSRATIEAMARRIGEHARTHGQERLDIVLHGGEPLLAGREVIERTVESIRAAVPSRTVVEVTLQTNGTLVDDRFIGLFRRHGIGVGVSVDGGRAATDRHRRYADGRSSFTRVERGLELLREADDIWTGLLCAVDLDNDPLEVYEDLLALRPPQIDLLLPLANWVHPPPGHELPGTPYADWLIPIFDRWFAAPERETGIRLFESLIKLSFGGHSDTEAVGLDSADAVTIETDGSLEVTDALKTTAPGLGALGLSVHTDPLDTAMRRPEVLAMRRIVQELGEACRSCPLAEVCGGGQFSHRYSPDGTFQHPSVYCRDLARLITHVDFRLRSALVPAA